MTMVIDHLVSANGYRIEPVRTVTLTNLCYGGSRGLRAELVFRDEGVTEWLYSVAYGPTTAASAIKEAEHFLRTGKGTHQGAI